MNKPVALAALLVCAAVSPLAGADPVKAVLEPSPQPLRLTDTKKMEAISKALKAANLPNVANPPTAAHYTLTPVAPTSNGAQITIAGPGVFMMSKVTGTFILQPSGGPSAVTMAVPTDIGKT